MVNDKENAILTEYQHTFSDSFNQNMSHTFYFRKNVPLSLSFLCQQLSICIIFFLALVIPVHMTIQPITLYIHYPLQYLLIKIKTFDYLKQSIFKMKRDEKRWHIKKELVKTIQLAYCKNRMMLSLI